MALAHAQRRWFTACMHDFERMTMWGEGPMPMKQTVGVCTEQPVRGRKQHPLPALRTSLASAPERDLACLSAPVEHDKAGVNACA